jgi:hypothetical protein
MKQIFEKIWEFGKDMCYEIIQTVYVGSTDDLLAPWRLLMFPSHPNDMFVIRKKLDVFRK